MPTLFACNVTLDVHTVILRGLIKHGNEHTIHRWLMSMPSRSIPLTPTLQQFHMFLEFCVRRAPYKYTRQVINTMSDTGCKPTNETYRYLIRSRWANTTSEEPPHPILFTKIFEVMKFNNMPYDRETEELLLKLGVESKYATHVRAINDQYRTFFCTSDVNDPEWNDDIAAVAQEKGVQEAINHYFKTMEPKGVPLTSKVIRGILRHSTSLEDLQLVQKQCNVTPTGDHFSLLIASNLRAEQLERALSIYKESKATGIVPDAGLVYPLIKELCRTPGKRPSMQNLDRALALYNDLAAVAEPSSQHLKESSEDHASGPDLAIYQTLLRGLSVSEQFDKYFPIAQGLLEDMETYNISTMQSKVAAPIIVLFMRRAKTLSEAMDVYSRLRSALDERGYESVLDAFCQLSFDSGLPVPSLTQYFDIVKDMRRAGLEITIQVYTIILRQFAVLPIQHRGTITQEQINQLVALTHRVHDFLTLDAAVSPDEQVWNQLMDTYQRLGCFTDAYKVWQNMFLTGRYNHISVSIIFDACGYARQWDTAKKIFGQLSRERFSLNQHNWNTWVEALCRMRRLNDALRVICLVMGKDGNTVPPDIETARIMIKFGRKYRVQTEVLRELERYLPDLWPTLPEDLRLFKEE
ncbi:hypothetical protein H0H93_004964 [Arthromyces matolae]|nr:hypothetical protein H0H93_004964 [Arthromyces matolae]